MFFINRHHERTQSSKHNASNHSKQFLSSMFFIACIGILSIQWQLNFAITCVYWVNKYCKTSVFTFHVGRAAIRFSLCYPEKQKINCLRLERNWIRCETDKIRQNSYSALVAYSTRVVPTLFVPNKNWLELNWIFTRCV